MPPLATKSLTSQGGGKDGRHLLFCCCFKEQDYLSWVSVSWPWTIPRGCLFSGSRLLFGLSTQVCSSVWHTRGPTLVTSFWTESNEAGACTLLFLAWNGGWFWMSLLAERVPLGFLLVCICICNVYVFSESCQRPFLSQINSLLCYIQIVCLLVLLLMGLGDFSVCQEPELPGLDKVLCNTWTSLANVSWSLLKDVWAAKFPTSTVSCGFEYLEGAFSFLEQAVADAHFVFSLFAAVSCCSYKCIWQSATSVSLSIFLI